MSIDAKEKAVFNTKPSGLTYGNISVAENTSGVQKFHGRQGHGFAAERAEHLMDIAHGKDAAILGDDNALNGADRIVNGVEIQSKYYQSGSACIGACFENGQYRYYSQNGKPMQVEVPYDMYEEAVSAMQRRIERNEVPGITDPAEAENLVKRGSFTYEQAKNIAKAGTVESLAFDAVNGAIIAKDAFGVTVAISLATSVWNGDSLEDALKNAAYSGLQVGGVTFLTTVVTSQLTRMGVATTIRSGTDILVKKLGSKVSAYIANSLRTGTNIYGAAAIKNVSKLLSSNILSGVASLVVLSIKDVGNLFRGMISTKQFLKNVTITGATIAGSGVGWTAGGAAGATIGGAIGSVGGPAGIATGAKIGGVVGNLVGSFAGGSVAGGASGKILDGLVEDDAVKMISIVECEFVRCVESYVLSEQEVNESLDLLKEKITPDWLKRMFQSKHHEQFAYDEIRSCVNNVISQRVYVKSVSEEQMLEGIRLVFEDAIDGTGIFGEETALSNEEIKDSYLQNRNISEAQIQSVMKPVLAMNKTQERAERQLLSMKRSNERCNEERIRLQEERQVYKDELQNLLDT